MITSRLYLIQLKTIQGHVPEERLTPARLAPWCLPHPTHADLLGDSMRAVGMPRPSATV
jgi:hypothetical protein